MPPGAPAGDGGRLALLLPVMAGVAAGPVAALWVNTELDPRALDTLPIEVDTMRQLEAHCIPRVQSDIVNMSEEARKRIDALESQSCEVGNMANSH